MAAEENTYLFYRLDQNVWEQTSLTPRISTDCELTGMPATHTFLNTYLKPTIFPKKGDKIGNKQRHRLSDLRFSDKKKCQPSRKADRGTWKIKLNNNWKRPLIPNRTCSQYGHDIPRNGTFNTSWRSTKLRLLNFPLIFRSWKTKSALLYSSTYHFFFIELPAHWWWQGHALYLDEHCHV